MPLDLFAPPPLPASAPVRRGDGAIARQSSAATATPARCSTTTARSPPSALGELAEAGYWGLLVDPKYGGQGAPFARFARFLTRMATLDPTVAGLASVHGCIGAVDPVRTFGTPSRSSASCRGWPAASGSRRSPSPSRAPAPT